MHAFVCYTIFHNSYIPPSVLAQHVHNSIKQVTEMYGTSPIGIGLSPEEFEIAQYRKDNWNQGLEVLTFAEIQKGQIFIRKRPLNYDVFKVDPKYLCWKYLDSLIHTLGEPEYVLISRYYRWLCGRTRGVCSPYPLLDEVWRPK